MPEDFNFMSMLSNLFGPDPASALAKKADPGVTDLLFGKNTPPGTVPGYADIINGPSAVADAVKPITLQMDQKGPYAPPPSSYADLTKGGPVEDPTKALGYGGTSDGITYAANGNQKTKTDKEADAKKMQMSADALAKLNADWLNATKRQMYMAPSGGSGGDSVGGKLLPAPSLLPTAFQAPQRQGFGRLIYGA